MRIATDGACKPNPGTGGWAFVIVLPGGGRIEKSGAHPDTTNNQMEMTALIRALESLPPWVATQQVPVRVETDSKYLRDGITRWIPKWRINGWRTAEGDEVKNQDLWRWIAGLCAPLRISHHWIPGHAGHALNERCDRLAVSARQRLASGRLKIRFECGVCGQRAPQDRNEAERQGWTWSTLVELIRCPEDAPVIPIDAPDLPLSGLICQ